MTMIEGLFWCFAWIGMLYGVLGLACLGELAIRGLRRVWP